MQSYHLVDAVQLCESLAVDHGAWKHCLVSVLSMLPMDLHTIISHYLWLKLDRSALAFQSVADNKTASRTMLCYSDKPLLMSFRGKQMMEHIASVIGPPVTFGLMLSHTMQPFLSWLDHMNKSATSSTGVTYDFYCPTHDRVTVRGPYSFNSPYMVLQCLLEYVPLAKTLEWVEHNRLTPREWVRYTIRDTIACGALNPWAQASNGPTSHPKTASVRESDNDWERSLRLLWKYRKSLNRQRARNFLQRYGDQVEQLLDMAGTYFLFGHDFDPYGALDNPGVLYLNTIHQDM